MTRTLVVWCPDWPVVAAGHGDGEPVAVLDAGRVVACSAAARAEGVERGLRRRQAEARCPGLRVAARDPAGEARAFEPVVVAAEAFTPGVQIVRPGVCAFATRGPSRYHGGDEALAARVAEAVAHHAHGRVGVADGRFAAELAARDGRIIPPGGSAAFLAPFPVATLGDPGFADLLVRLGLPTLGDLAHLPERDVFARFGWAGASAHRLARAVDDRPRHGREIPLDLAVTAELDPPADRLDTVAFVARGLAAHLHRSVSERGLALDLVRIEAETEHGEVFVRTWRLDARSARSGHGDGPLCAHALAERVRWQLDGWLTGAGPTHPTGPLVLLRLVPEGVQPDRGRQEGFWGGDREAADRTARALERVQGRLGPEAVATAVPAGGRHPAEQYRLLSWGDPPPGSRGPEPPPWPGRVPAPAPATIAPSTAEVVDAAGRLVGVDGRGLPTAAPARLSVAGGPRSPVVAWAGPWPVDERWWDPAAHRRRARWQVVTASGDAHLLVLEHGRWTVEATYD